MIKWIKFFFAPMLLCCNLALGDACELLNKNLETFLPNTRLKLGDELKIRISEAEVVDATFLGATKDKLFFLDQVNKDTLGIQEKIFWIESHKFTNRPLADEILNFEKQKGGSCQSFAAANCLVASNFIHKSGMEARAYAERRNLLMEMTFELIFGVKYKDYSESKVKIDKSKEQHSKIFTLLANHLGGKENVGFLQSSNIDLLFGKISEGKVAYLGAKFEPKLLKFEDGASKVAATYVMQEITPIAAERHAVAIVGAITLKNGIRKFIVLDSGGGFIHSKEGGLAVWDVHKLKNNLEMWEKEGKFLDAQSRPYIAIFGSTF